jgi:two-component system sensor histidine kinase DesK
LEGQIALEITIDDEDAFVMAVYVVVLSLAALRRRAIPIVVALTAVALFLPPLIPSWHAPAGTVTAFSIGLVTLAMYGFFEVIRSNRALTEARAEVARLAAEHERNRIARDLHDLLGHSLTTLTLKAGLANRLAGRDPARATAEMAEVESLARRALADVRAAVTSYREVTLTGELASGRELLRAAGIEADLPPAADIVRPDRHELVAWVVREGLTNVVRHSRAPRCRVELGPGHVEITDDGVGGAELGGGSLQGLRERVAAAGGTVAAGPRPGGGWRLRVDLGPGDSASAPAGREPSERARPAGPTRRPELPDPADPAEPFERSERSEPTRPAGPLR